MTEARTFVDKYVTIDIPEIPEQFNSMQVLWKRVLTSQKT